MAAVQHAYLAGCCEVAVQCCSTIDGVWYLCLAILVLVLLISFNNLFMSHCHFIGFPWSKTKLYYIHDTSAEEIQLLLVNSDFSNDQQSSSFSKRSPPPPYSVIEQSVISTVSPS